MTRGARPLSRWEWINAAYEIISEGGRFSVRVIADRIGVSTGSLYHHFNGRDDLVLEVNRRHMTESLAFLDLADAAPEPRLKLETFLRDVFASIDYMRADLALEAERSNLEIDQVSRDGEERIDGWLRQVLIDIGFESQGAYRQIVLMRLVYVGMATSIAINDSAWSAEDRDVLSATLSGTIIAAADCGST